MPKGKIKPPKVEDFADAAPVGTRVRFYPVLPADEDAFEESAVRSAPWSMGGRTVVMIDGRSGGVDCGHLVLINPVRRIGGVAGFVFTSR